MYDPTKEGEYPAKRSRTPCADFAAFDFFAAAVHNSRFDTAPHSTNARGYASQHQHQHSIGGTTSDAQHAVSDNRTYQPYPPSTGGIPQPDVSLPSIKDFTAPIARQSGMNAMQAYAVAPGVDVVPGEGSDRAAGWSSRSRGQEMGSQSHLGQPYYSAAYGGFEQQGSMVPDQNPRQQQLGASHGYYAGSGRAPETGSSNYYQAQSYAQSQSQQLQQPASSQARHPPSDYPYATSSGTSATQYYQLASYPAQPYGGDEYYPQNGQPSSASTFPSAMSAGASGGGTYHSISPPTLPLVESHHPRPLLQPSGQDRIIRTESNEVQSTPEHKGSFKKDPQETSESKRKGKGKAVVAQAQAAAGSDYGEDDDAQEGNGKEGKASTADFIRRLWTMMQAFSLDGELGEGGKFLDWSASGDSFVIKDKHHFEKNILVQHFRHCNFSSFVRQLNKYGFKKWWEFRHPDFRQDGQIVLELIKRKAANPKKVRANGDAALRQEAAAQHAMEAGIGIPQVQPKPNQPPGQQTSSFGDTIVQQQVQSLMQLNSNLSSRIRDLEGEMEGLKSQMKVQQEKDRRKEEWFPSLVAFIVRNLNNLNAMDGAGQILTELNSLHATLDKENVAMLNLDEILPNTIPPTTSGTGVQASDLKPRVPMFPFMDQQMSSSNGPAWGAQAVADSSRSATMATGPSAPMLGLGNSDNMSMEPLLSGRNSMSGQNQDLTIPDYGNGETVMQMQQVDMDDDQLPVVGAPGREGSGTKRNTMSNWTSSLSWTKAPRVLVVEDDAVSRNLAIRFLQLIGCEVDQVTDAESAIAKINTSPFDVVFMDIVLPKMTGHDATRLLRASNVTLPIIPMTSSFGDDDRKRYDAHGMTDLLPKPFSRDQLYSMLERHLSHLKAAKRYAIQIPPSVGVPPLSDQGVHDALRYSAAHYDKIIEGYNNPEEVPMWNPLSGTGTSDAQFVQMIGLQQSLNQNGEPIDFNQIMQTAASTSVEFTMMPSNAFAAGMGMAAGNVNTKRDREDEQEEESSKRAKISSLMPTDM